MNSDTILNDDESLEWLDAMEIGFNLSHYQREKEQADDEF